MQLTLYRDFSKKVNSTKRPEDGYTREVFLKENTSIESPVFKIDGVDLDVNYCYFAGHYYYITDIVLSNNNIYELHCKQDLLATYKDDITASSAYVEYSQTSYNTMIPDNRISMTDDVEIAYSEQALFAGYNAGSYVLTVVGNAAAGTGFTDIWNISASELVYLIDYLYTDDVLERLKKIFSNPYDCIVSCKWIPWNVSGTYSTIYLGDTQSNAQGIPIPIETKSFTKLTKTINIPRRYGDFRDFSPVSAYELYLPFYGTTTIDGNLLEHVDTLTIDVSLDNINGEILYTVKTSSRIIGYFNAGAGVNMNIAQLSNNILGSATSIAGGAIAGGVAIASMVASGGATTPMVASTLGGIIAVGNGIATGFTDIPSTKGGQGGYARAMEIIKSGATDTVRNIVLTQISHVLAESPSSMASKAGRPCFKVKNLGSLTGYVKCSGASIDIAGLGEDKTELNSWINQGIYIE